VATVAADSANIANIALRIFDLPHVTQKPVAFSIKHRNGANVP
jgi:hypothetical protein